MEQYLVQCVSTSGQRSWSHPSTPSQLTYTLTPPSSPPPQSLSGSLEKARPSTLSLLSATTSGELPPLFWFQLQFCCFLYQHQFLILARVMFDSSFDSSSCAKTQHWSSSSSWSPGSCDESKLMARRRSNMHRRAPGCTKWEEGYCKAVRQPLWMGRQTNSYLFGEFGGETLTGLWKCLMPCHKGTSGFPL